MYLANGQFDRCETYNPPTRHDTRNGLTVTHQPYPASHINPNSSVSYTTSDQATLIEDQLTASGSHPGSPGRPGRGGVGGRRGGGSRIGSRRGIHKNKQPEIRPWNSNLLACCDDPEICITGLACCPCLASRLSERLGENPLACCLPFGCVALRVKLRTQHHIQGDICSDYGVTCCCGCPLSLCQMWRELDYIEKKNNPGSSANGSHGNQGNNTSTSSRSFLDMLTF
ncbi:uncharacterized protein LOC100889887 isoform X2 [Strongylocentrotus purpuratus]|uniref:Uncharacterized protein n=1 Tax=Strongylocentrotus purpuratus TaxID=7668 RepID=A0A7M7GEE8_STRPU|nr:uncharacterized protein LOC100889887 isoform X2 [Strongylocentrotus purpuratus]